MSRYLRVVYSGARDGDIKRSLQNVMEKKKDVYLLIKTEKNSKWKSQIGLGIRRFVLLWAKIWWASAVMERKWELNH